MGTKPKDDPRQILVDFDGARIACKERWMDILRALGQMGGEVDAELKLFLNLVYGFTHDGLAHTYKQSIKGIASRPHGICCSRSKAQQVVDLAERWGLVTVKRNRKTNGAAAENEYAINWPGVLWVTFHATPWPEAHTAMRYTLTARQPTSTAQRYQSKEVINSFEMTESSGPVPEAPSTGPVVGSMERNNSDAPVCVAVNDRGGPVATPIVTRGDALRDQLCRTVPELITAVAVTLEPLDPGPLVYGAFSAIETRHIQRPVLLAQWLRMQSGLEQPVLPGTEADALLVIAAGVYVRDLPQAEIRKNRVACFVNVISRRQWRLACPLVPEARRLLDGVIALPEKGPAWLGRPSLISNP